MRGIQTVTGVLPEGEMGVVGHHEHVIWGLPGTEYDSEWWFYWPEVFDKAIRDLCEFREYGGDTIVDVSGIGLGRHPSMYPLLSVASGVSIVMCTGFWADDGILPSFRNRSVEELEELFVRELTDGAEGTGVRAGIVKVANSIDHFTGLEERTFRAAARAARVVGCAVTTHGVHFAERQLQILLEEGLPGGRVIIGHLDDATSIDLERDKRLADQGAFISYDHVGITPTWSPATYAVTDWERARMVKSMIAAGYLDQILISSDSASFLFGYQHTSPLVGQPSFSAFLKFREVLSAAGVKEDEQEQILRDNPRRALCYEV